MKRVLWVVLFAALCATAGCGAGGVDVDGKVVNGGAPYTLAEGEAINIALQATGATGSATVQKDGTFVAKRSDGKPLPPGQYKVSITHYPPVDAGAAAAGKAPKGPPTPKTKTAGETWDVSSSAHTFTLDLAKYK
jgi:hypothetical protein